MTTAPWGTTRMGPYPESSPVPGPGWNLPI